MHDTVFKLFNLFNIPQYILVKTYIKICILP